MAALSVQSPSRARTSSGRLSSGHSASSTAAPKQQPSSTPSPPTATALHLDSLPRDLLVRVLSSLTFEEVAATRATCRTVARAAEEVMARAFDSFGALLLRRIRDLRLAPDFSFYTCLVCKTLYHIEIEYRLLRAAVGVYVREGAAPFVGGRLLDVLWEALRLAGSPPAPSAPPTPSPRESSASGRPVRPPATFSDLFTPDIVDELSSLVEQYVAFFEKEVEPRLRTPTPLCVKIVDALDAFVGGSSDAEMRTHGGWRSLRARYHLPLTGLMFHDDDLEPTTRIIVPEGEVRSLLAALREAARKSGQRYVSALLQRELASAETRRGAAHAGLFAARRRCVARDRLPCSKPSTPGIPNSGCTTEPCVVLRERLERRPLRDPPPPPPEPDREALVLRAAVRLRFLLNQRPLEADCLGVPLDEEASNSGGISAAVGSNDPGGWGWTPPGGNNEEETPPPDGSSLGVHDDARTAFWFQLEVHRLEPGCPASLHGPVPTLGPTQGTRRRLSFQPARFRRLRPAPGSRHGVTRGAANASTADERVLSVSLRDVCVSYVPPLPPRNPQEARVSVTYGRLRRAPSTVAMMSEGASAQPSPITSTLPSSPSSTPPPLPSPPDDSSAAAAMTAAAAAAGIRQGLSPAESGGSALEQLRRVLAAASSVTARRGSMVTAARRMSSGGGEILETAASMAGGGAAPLHQQRAGAGEAMAPMGTWKGMGPPKAMSTSADVWRSNA